MSSTSDSGFSLEPQRAAPGSLRLPAQSKRKTDLSVPELIEDLQTALAAAGDLEESPRVGRLLGQLFAANEHRLDVFGNRFARTTKGNLFRMLSAHPACTPELVRGATFVDLGCGALNPLSGLLVLIAAGAARGIGIDLEQVEDEPTAIRALARTAIELIAEPSLYLGQWKITGEQVRQNLARFDIRALCQGQRDALHDVGLEFRHVRAEDTGIPGGSVDGIFSASFLEHLPDIDAVVREAARITRHGGIGAHRIDGIDHRSYGTPKVGPHDFLREQTNEPLVFGCNRVRPSEFAALFERGGFDVLDVKVLRRSRVTEQERAEFAEPYRSMDLETLSIVGARFAVQRR